MEKTRIALIIFGIILVALSFFADNKAQDISQLLKNPFLDSFMEWITPFANIFLVLIVISSLFLWEEKKREWIPAIWISFVVTVLIVIILKLLIARERPFEVMFIPFTGLIDYSFPSLHAAAAFTALPVLDKEFPKIRWFWILFAVLIGFSRIYLGVHYLSDVVFGAMIGYCVGWFIVYIEDTKKVFKKWIWK